VLLCLLLKKMEEAQFVQQVAACLEEVTRGRLAEQVLPRVAEPDLSAAIADETLRLIACDASGLTLLERLADARLSETHAERLDGLGVVSTLIGQYIVYGSKHAATARDALKNLTKEQNQAVFSTTDTLAVVNEDADPLQRAVIRTLSEPPSDAAALEVAHVFLNRMPASDLLKNLDNALTFCEEVEYLAMDMQPVATPPDEAADDEYHASDPVELGISAQIPSSSMGTPVAETAPFPDEIRKFMLPTSFSDLAISEEGAERSSSPAAVAHPLTPPKDAGAQLHLSQEHTVEPRGRDNPQTTTKSSDRGTSMSPERVKGTHSVFYNTAAHPFDDGAQVSPERSSESVPDVVDEVLTCVDADFASPRISPSSARSPLPIVSSITKDASFTQFSASSPSASGDELFSKMYSAFMSSRRNPAAASSMAATAAATVAAPLAGSRSDGGARTVAFR
jgi:hypothetical protein